MFAAAFVLFALQAASADPLLTCPDGSACADSNTCCKLPTGLYSCCPYANAVCCTGTNSCCPQGGTCDLTGGCLRVQCPDGTSCPSGNTCCYDRKTTDYACCPNPEGVCCADGIHCCPNGYTCDLPTLKCLKGDTKILLFRKRPSLKSALPKQPTLQQKLKQL